MKVIKTDITALPIVVQTQLLATNGGGGIEVGITPTELIKVFIQNNTTHKHYDRVVKMANKNKILATGEHAEELLEQFNPRESKEEFEQRARLTKIITPAIYNSIVKPFNKANRNNNITIAIDLKEKSKIVEQMRKGFFQTHKHSDAQGLDYWLKTEYLTKSFIDPNSWLVVEWTKGNSETDPYKPYPFVVSSKDALNYNIKNNELNWLFVQRKVDYISYDVNAKKLVQKEGVKYIYYAEGVTVTATQCCTEYINRVNPLDVTQELWQKDNTLNFIIEQFNTNLDFVPAFRMGYVQDIETNGETFAPPYQPAMAYFDKSVKTGSEFDLSVCLHLFPQKTELREMCKGVQGDRCNAGKSISGADCKACKGTGYTTIMSAQDVRIVMMPEDSEDLKNIDLAKLTHYHTPPIELLRFQKELLDSYFLDSHRAIFGTTTMIEQKVLGVTTATEVDSNFQAVYDTIEPFTEKISELFKSIVTVFFHLTGASENVINDARLIHRYPADLKLKSLGQLLSDLERANEAGAPPFLIANITNDIADITLSDDVVERIKYEVKAFFYPFNGKSKEEILQLMASDYVSRESKVLYANFEPIFKEIEIENPNFYLTTINNFNSQWETIKKKIQEFEVKTTDDPRASLSDINFNTTEVERTDNEEVEVIE